MDFFPNDELKTTRKLDILIVEDNVINKLIITKMLIGVGHSIEVTTNGKEACDLLSHKSFDLIIMDVHMPVMDGLEATQIIRASGNDIPILGCTADSYSGDINKFKAFGMDDVVIKPIHLGILLFSINRVMGEDLHRQIEDEMLMPSKTNNST